MYRVLSAFVLSGLLLLLTAVAPRPASAGDYYYGDSYRSHYRSYTSSSCCYRRAVRYERVYSEDYERPYDRRHYDNGYDGRSSYYGPSYVTSRHYEPRHYYGDDYASSYAESCYGRRIRIYDGRGGWVWGTPANCY